MLPVGWLLLAYKSYISEITETKTRKLNKNCVFNIPLSSISDTIFDTKYFALSYPIDLVSTL